MTPLSGPDDPRYNDPSDWRYDDNHPEEGVRQFYIVVAGLTVIIYVVCKCFGWHIVGLID